MIYGVEINKDEIKNKIKFTKIAHIGKYEVHAMNQILNKLKVWNEYLKICFVVERKGNSFYVKGDLNKYVLDINENYFSVTPYETE